MPDSLDMLIPRDDLVRSVEGNLLPVSMDLLRPKTSRRITAAAFKPASVLPHSSEDTILSFFEPSPAKAERNRFQGAKFVTLSISICTFVVWVGLMLTVAAGSGTLFQIVLITMIPFIAHVVSMSLTARGAAGIST